MPTVTLPHRERHPMSTRSLWLGLAGDLLLIGGGVSLFGVIRSLGEGLVAP